MIIYITYIVLLFFLLMSYPQKKDSFVYLILTLLLLLMYYGFSYIDTADMQAYQYMFDSISNPKFDSSYSSERIEVGFRYLLFGSKVVNRSYYFFQFLVLTIELMLLTSGLKRLGMQYKMISISYIFLFSLFPVIMVSALRQGIVISIFIYALPYIIEKRYVRYVVCCLIGYFFHRSSLLLLIVPILYLVGNYLLKKNTSIVPFLIVFLTCNLVYFFDLRFSVENLGSSIFEGDFSETTKLNSYSQFQTTSTELSGYGPLKIIEMDFCFFMSFLFNKKGVVNNNRLIDQSLVCISILFLIYFVLNTLFDVSMSIHRLNYYFMLPYYILLFYNLLTIFKEIKLHITLSNLIIFLYFFVFDLITNPLSSRIFEYHISDIF